MPLGISDFEPSKIHTSNSEQDLRDEVTVAVEDERDNMRPKYRNKHAPSEVANFYCICEALMSKG